MKKITAVLLIAVLLLSSLSFSGCGKKELVVTENTGKLIVIEAKRASEGNFFVTGTLEVADGEKIAITSGLKKGEIKIEILSLDGLDDSSTVPDLNGAGVIMIGNMAPAMPCQELWNPETICLELLSPKRPWVPLILKCCRRTDCFKKCEIDIKI